MLGVALICIACTVYWLWLRKKTKTTEPPLFPGAWPIVGHIPLLVTDSCTLWQRLNDTAKHCNDMGGVVSCDLLIDTMYIVTDPDDCLTVATQCLEKSSYYSFGKDIAGNGLITARYSTWKPHRKLLNPAFSQTLLDTFMGVFNSQSRKLVKDLEKEVGKGPFDHWTYLRYNTLESICLTSLGIDFTDPNLNSEYFHAIDMILKTLVERYKKIWWHKSSLFAWSKLKKEQDYYIKIMHNMSNTVIQNRKSKFNGNTCAEINITGTKFRPFIDLLLELALEKGAFTDKEIREHVDTMLGAGHDTTANVLMFTVMLLGSHPEVQEKVFADWNQQLRTNVCTNWIVSINCVALYSKQCRFILDFTISPVILRSTFALNEIQEVVGGDKDVDKTDLSKLVYLEAVLNESMRVFTIVPVLARILDKDIKLKNYTLSAGRTCALFLLGLHKHPIWGPDADEFHPERWLEPGRLPDNPSAFAPFSLGRRHCIGKTYAMMSMKTTLAHVVRRYKITADITKLRVNADVVLKPLSGHSISIEERVLHRGR